MAILEIKLKNFDELITIPINNIHSVINDNDVYSKTFNQLLKSIHEALDKDGFLELLTGDDKHYILIKAEELAMIHINTNQK